MPLIYVDTGKDMQLNRIFISLEYELMWENNQYLSSL